MPLPNPPFHAYQRLERELSSWEELRHKNVLPFYGMYIFRTLHQRGSHGSRFYRDSHRYRTTPLHGEWVITRERTRGRFKFFRYHRGRKTETYLTTSDGTLE